MHEDLEIVRVLRCAWNFAILLTSVGKLSNRDVLSTAVASFLTTFRLVGAGVRGKGVITEGHIVLCELVKLHTSLVYQELVTYPSAVCAPKIAICQDL